MMQLNLETGDWNLNIMMGESMITHTQRARFLRNWYNNGDFK